MYWKLLWKYSIFIALCNDNRNCMNCTYTENHKRWHYICVITLENLDRFLEFFALKQKEIIKTYEKCPPHICVRRNITLRCENETSHFVLLSCTLSLSCCIKHGVKHKIHQVQGKQIDSHKVCSKCPFLAQTQARKGDGHWSTASSISDCCSSKLHHTCSRRCRSSSIS